MGSGMPGAALGTACQQGTDCTDCGPRAFWPPPPLPPPSPPPSSPVSLLPSPPAPTPPPSPPPPSPLSLPLASTDLTAEEIEIEIAANTITNAIATSLCATIAVSVATTIGATVAASSTTAVAASAAAGAASASAGGIGGGAAGAASGGAGGGLGGGMSDLITVLMSAQRLSVLASMPVDISKLHLRVGKSLAWTNRGLGLFPRIVPEDTLSHFWDWLGARPNKGDGRRSSVELGSDDVTELSTTTGATEEEEAWVGALEGLIDTFTTLAFALAAVTTHTAPSLFTAYSHTAICPLHAHPPESQPRSLCIGATSATPGAPAVEAPPESQV